MNSKLHTLCDGQGRPLVMLLTEGQTSDYKGAALMLDTLPQAKAMLGDRGVARPGEGRGRRLVPQCADRQGHRAVHPVKE